MDLNTAMRRYRECARHIWNTYFQPMPDGWHEFINVESALFSSLVLSAFEPRQGLYRKHPDRYFEAVAVVPVDSPRGVPMLHVREEAGKPNQWEEGRLEGSPVDMRFIEFFDFANIGDPLDFKWVRSRVVGPARHPLVGEGRPARDGVRALRGARLTEDLLEKPTPKRLNPRRP